MDAKTKIKVNHFGKVEKLIMNVLLVVGVVVILICAISTVYVESLFKDLSTLFWLFFSTVSYYR